MRIYCLIVCSLVAFSDALKTMPDYLERLRCSRSDPDISRCIWNSFEEARPIFQRGIPEFNMPPMDPFELPLMTVNRTVNELVRIVGTGKNIKVSGAAKAIIEDLKADVDTLSGEVRVFIPSLTVEMEYDVNGQLLIVPMRSKGFFIGNFTDLRFYTRSSLKTYNRNDVEYFKINKIFTKFTIGDGHIQMREKDPQLQYAANLIANFYNEDPQRTMEAIHPICVETANELIRLLGDQILSQLPASEWLKD